MEGLTAALLGTLVGILTGLIPGLHLNTIAAVAFVVAPNAGPVGAMFLLAVGTVHTIVNVLPATYLGAPDEDDVVAVLPAHRLLLAGRGPDAVAVSVAASLTGVLAAVCIGVGLHTFLASPAFSWVDAWTPLALVAAMGILWMQETRRVWRNGLRAMAVSCMAAALGLVSMELALIPWVQVAPTALLPMLGGLFGAAGLTIAIGKPPPVPMQVPLRRAVRRPTIALVGSGLAGITALMPGLTSSVAAAMVPGIRGRPLHAVAAVSAINTAHAVLAMIVWLSTGRIRTGLADAMSRWNPAQWVGILPGPQATPVLVVIVGAAILGAVATIGLEHLARPWVHRLPSRTLALAGLTTLTALVAVLSGWLGLVFYVLCIIVGRAPIQWGVRRVHLVACLIAPVVMRTWT